METFAGFRPAAFTFLRGLARNNNREWFAAHRDEYENEVRAPMRTLIDELDAVLGAIAPEFRGDPRRSMFRIHRDVRFSADKSPYKTNAAFWLHHRDIGHGTGRAAHGGAGFYFQLEPRDCFVSGGIWMPPKPALDALRARLADDHATFTAIIRSPRFRVRFGDLSNEAMLTRVPRGYPADHPAANLLRYKSFTVSRPIRQKDTMSRQLLPTLQKDIEVLLPFARWINGRP